jgi:isoquinoline 1-oxidoreductase beta subunit
VTPILNVSRRGFLRASGIAATGLVLGVRGVARGEGAGETALNAFVEIGADDLVTIHVSRSEMGQGVTAALPMLVSEELEVDWTQVRTRQADLDPRYGSQNTFGDLSVRESWEPLRRAGAAARTMLVAAAAARWGVAAAECRAERGAVHHAATGLRARYGELAAAAARLPVPAEVPLKPPSEFRLIGRSLARPDLEAVVTGKTVYGIDVIREGMLFAVVRRAPVFGASVESVDDRAALAVPGVRAVVRVPADRASRQPWDGVAVVAESTWAAIKGRDALDVRYRNPAGPLESSDAYARRLGEALDAAGHVTRREGDVERAFAGAARTLEATYEFPFLAHATMEPPACVAHSLADGCEVWAPTQTPERVAMFVSSYLGCPRERVRVHVSALGGGFGRKTYNDYVLEAAWVSRAVKAPVRLMMTRDDDLRHDFYRPAQRHRLRAALDARGRLLGWHHRVAGAAVSAYVRGDWQNGYAFEETGGAFDVPYRIPNVLVEFTHVDTLVPRGVWRSVSHSATNFAVQTFLDEVAQAAGSDPVALRRELIGEPRRIPYPPPDDAFFVDSGRTLRVLEAAARAAGWGAPLAAGRARGVAVLDGGGAGVAQVAEVSLDPDTGLRVHRVVCAIECGIAVNPDGVRAQVEGGVAFGLSAAIAGRITVRDGAVAEGNLHEYTVLSFAQMPRVEVEILPSTAAPNGVGEPPVPPVAPAVANALAALTGRRLRRLPFPPEELRARSAS